MFKSIVWANDGSEAADRARSYVEDLARASDGASITIAHVVETGHSSGATFIPRRGEELEIVEKLRQVERDLEAQGFNVSLEIRDEARARPSHDIAEIARAAGADLIVVTSSGGSAVAMMLGSVTYRLLHIAPCPVLVIRPTESESAS